ncbi:MAG TPA: aminopeptidase [Thermoanaerobaculia bacterium]|nr:aminopeptidase [Thermoanaerobaculia bacterium]
MRDPRYDQLARLLVRYSCGLGPGENVLIEAMDVPPRFVQALIAATREVGARPFVQLKNLSVMRELLLGATHEQFDLQADAEVALMARMHASIGVRGGDNVAEFSDVPRESMRIFESTVFQRVHLDLRIKNTRWVVLRWPSPSMAQLAGTSTEAFEDFFFRVCTLDYAKMSRALVPLKELMEATDRVRLVSPGTDLSFSIKDIPAVACDGQRNIPDGEVYTAPVRDSIEGVIQFNAPTIYRGVTHERVMLRFEQGRVVEATSSNTAHLNEVLDSDEGARYVGEFAIAFNPHITTPMKDILFDEKIAGSIHLTPGNAYQEAWNGNHSQIHWDLVLMMAPEHGGGEIWFDDQLVRKDGLFVPEALQDLNPERLAG